MKYVILTLFLLLFNLLGLTILRGQPASDAQESRKLFFGPQLGGFAVGSVGTSVHDSVAIFSINPRWIGPYGSFYVEKPFTNSLSLRAEITYTRIGMYFWVMDLRPDPYWGFTTPQRRTVLNSNIQIPVLLTVHLPRPLNYFSVLGGLDSHFQFRGRKNTNTIPNGHPGFSPKAVDIHNNLYRTTRTYVPYGVFGLRWDFGRSTLIARFETNLSRSYSRNIPAWGQSLPLNTSKSYLHVALAHKFYSLKRKNKAVQGS